MNKRTRVIVVEDNQNKIDSIKELVGANFEQVDIDFVVTPSDAIEKLKKNKYNFMILDMSLPSYIDEYHIISSLAGKQILQTMKHKKIHVPTVILTQWDVFGHHDNAISLQDLKSELLEKYASFLLGVFFWDSSSELWKDEIVNHMKEFIRD